MTTVIGSPPAQAPEWIYVGTYTANAAATLEASSLAVHKTYRVIVKAIGSTTSQDVRLTLNGDAGSTYVDLVLASGNSVAFASGVTFSRIGSISNAGNTLIEMTLEGTNANKQFAATVQSANNGTSQLNGVACRWGSSTDTQINKITLTPASGTITGTMIVYGRDDI